LIIINSDFYFTAASWFPGNVLIKSHSTNSAPPPSSCSLSYWMAHKLMRFCHEIFGSSITGKSLSEALIFASTNPQYDNRLFMKIVSSKYLQNMLCTQIDVFVLFWHSEQFWYTTCSADVARFKKRFTCKSLRNKLSYFFELLPQQLHQLLG
jgi:hypothetical protein